MGRVKSYILKFLVVLIILNIVVDLGFCFLRYDIDKTRLLLLCKTDHNELLEACRTLLDQVENDEIPIGSYRLKGVEIQHPEIIAKFPKPILSASPVSILIHPKGYVNLVLRQFPIHFGFNAFSEQFEPSYKNYNYGDKEVISGLWYYDEDHDEKKIETIMSTGKIRLIDEYYPTSLLIFKDIIGFNSNKITE